MSEAPERSGDRGAPASDGVGESEGQSPSDEDERMQKMLAAAEKRGAEGVKE